MYKITVTAFLDISFNYVKILLNTQGKCFDKFTLWL